MSEANPTPKHATTTDDDARVTQAAADLGVEVPDGFFLMGMGGGQLTALMPGSASEVRVAAAILRRLDGHSVADSLNPPDAEERPQPAWMPPADPDDAEAWDAWMTERARHPEWPVILDGPTDWVPLITGASLTALITSAASVMKQRDRIKFAKWLVKKREERGLAVDAVAMMRAFEGAAPESASEISTQADSVGPSEGKRLEAPPETPEH